MRAGEVDRHTVARRRYRGMAIVVTEPKHRCRNIASTTRISIDTAPASTRRASSSLRFHLPPLQARPLRQQHHCRRTPPQLRQVTTTHLPITDLRPKLRHRLRCSTFLHRPRLPINTGPVTQGTCPIRAIIVMAATGNVDRGRNHSTFLLRLPRADSTRSRRHRRPEPPAQRRRMVMGLG